MPTEREQYPYPNEYGGDNYRVVRRGHGEDKEFFIQSVDANGKWKPGLNGHKPVPYNLPAVIKAKNQGKSVHITEGEKDADTATKLGLVATTNHGGAGKWTDEHSKHFLGLEEAVILWDRDEKGRKHAWVVHDSLRRFGVERITFKRAVAGKDLTDHIGEGFKISDLVVQKPKRPETNDSNPEVEVEHPEKDLPWPFRLVMALSPTAKPEYGKDHQYNALCPAHDDHSPSLSIKLSPEGKTLLTCQKGCKFSEIAAAYGISIQDLSRGYEESEEEKLKNSQKKLMKARHQAQVELESEQIKNLFPASEFDEWNGADEIALPDEPVKFLVDGLFPHSGRVMLSAREKTGKTCFNISLVKAFCDNVPFLGAFKIEAPEESTVLYLNYEMSPGMFRRWLKRADIKDAERLLVKHLRGRLFPFWQPEFAQELGEYCKRMNVHLVIIDTQAAAMRGFVTNENDNMEVSRWHGAVDDFLYLGEVPNCAISHHMGYGSVEHGRGASSMGAWPEVLWFLTKDESFVAAPGKQAPRSFRSEGRDSTLDPIELEYDDVTGLYSYGGVPRLEQRQERILNRFVERLVGYRLAENEWPTKKVAESLLGVKKDRRAGYIELAAQHGFVRLVPGERGAIRVQALGPGVPD